MRRNEDGHHQEKAEKKICLHNKLFRDLKWLNSGSHCKSPQ